MDSATLQENPDGQPQNHDTPLDKVQLSLSVKPRFKRRTGGPGGLGVVPIAETGEIPVVLNAALLKTHFNMPLHAAAKSLGVCATAIKKQVPTPRKHLFCFQPRISLIHLGLIVRKSVLKSDSSFSFRVCRKVGIKQWPHRQVGYGPC